MNGEVHVNEMGNRIENVPEEQRENESPRSGKVNFSVMIVHSTGEDFNRVECGHRVLARDE